MLLKYLAPLCVIAICAGTLLAGEREGKLKRVDRDNLTLTITVDNKFERTYKVNSDTQFYEGDQRIDFGINSNRLRPGTLVTVSAEGSGDLATRVKITAQSRLER
jgi:hypothetical protein